MKKHGTWYVPTIIASKFFAEEDKVPGYLPPQVAEKVLTVGRITQATAGMAD